MAQRLWLRLPGSDGLRVRVINLVTFPTSRG